MSLCTASPGLLQRTGPHRGRPDDPRRAPTAHGFQARVNETRATPDIEWALRATLRRKWLTNGGVLSIAGENWSSLSG